MNRIYHTWEKWECFPAGFYESRPSDKRSGEDCEQEYMALLIDSKAFGEALEKVLANWPKSCEHYLSNDRMNRIAWLGQASLCISRGIPSTFRGGFNRLTPSQRNTANLQALCALNKWLANRGEPTVDLVGAGVEAKADLY